MASVRKRDTAFENIPSIKAKTLRINLNPDIYGTFAEIGAGQETARHFFRSGGASGTIAKAMSAYDKDFSDAIYGIEKDGRYVTQPRLHKMLAHEMQLMEERISRDKHPERLFFSYANTVATIDFSKRYKGHGWIGIRFQLDPTQKEYDEIIIHVRFKQNEARLQQETLGILGVNLIYGAFYKYDKPRKMLKYLYDHIDKDTIEIDMINFSGPNFKEVDNRLMSLQLIKNNMTDAVMFGPDGNNLLPAAVLYKKNILALRGSFRPVTKVNMDMFEKSKELFFNEKKVNPENSQIIFEITLSNLRAEGEINERDFLDRAEILCGLGSYVMVSNLNDHADLATYLNRCRVQKIRMPIGIMNLIFIYGLDGEKDLSQQVLKSFGELFSYDVKLYAYPYQREKDGEIITAKTLKTTPELENLHKHFLANNYIEDIENFNEDHLQIFSYEIIEKIRGREDGWEENVPEYVAEMIKRKCLFDYPCSIEERQSSNK